jgi:hypothetical protein
MAKQKISRNGAAVNKSAAVREALSARPEATAKEIMGDLAQKGIKVEPSLVYFIRAKLRHKVKKQKRQRIIEGTKKAGIVDPVKLILQVKSLAQDAGGIKHLKQLVDALAE